MHSDISHYIHPGFFHDSAPYLPLSQFKLSPEVRQSGPVRCASIPNWAQEEQIDKKKPIYCMTMNCRKLYAI